MANQTGRPVASARKLIAAVLGTIALFVMVFGLGMASWAIVALGGAMLALAIVLSMANVMRRGERTWVVGQGLVKAISEIPLSSAYGRAEIQLTVVAPGLSTADVLIRDPRVPVAKWPRPGDTLPITVDLLDIRRVRIDWSQAADQGESGDPPPPEPYEPVEEYLDDDLLGTPEPPPWATRDRVWGRGPEEPQNEDLILQRPIVVRDTPAGPVLEGQFEAHDDLPRVLPQRARSSDPVTAAARPSPRPRQSQPSSSTSSSPTTTAPAPADPQASAVPEQRAAGRPAPGPWTGAPPATPDRQPTAADAPAAAASTAAAGPATATATTGPATASAAASPATAPAGPATADRPATGPVKADGPAAATSPATADRLADPEHKADPDRAADADLDEDAPAAADRPESASRSAAADPLPEATSPDRVFSADSQGRVSSADLDRTPADAEDHPEPDPVVADQPEPAAEQSLDDPPQPATLTPPADHDIDLPLDGDPEPAPEFQPRAQAAMASGLIAPPADTVPDQDTEPTRATQPPQLDEPTPTVEPAPATEPVLVTPDTEPAPVAPDTEPADLHQAEAAPQLTDPETVQGSPTVTSDERPIITGLDEQATETTPADPDHRESGQADPDPRDNRPGPIAPTLAGAGFGIALGAAANDAESNRVREGAPSPRGPWADLEGGYEPDERADDLITAYPSARPGPAGAIHGIGITILVTDMDRSITFYRDTLGFFEIDSGQGSAVLASGDTRLVLRTVHSLSGDLGRPIHLNLEVGDVEAVYQELLHKNVRFEHAPRAVNRGDKLELWAATFHDPDGHSIAITQWRATR